MEEKNKTPKKSSIVFRKPLEKRNHKASLVDVKNNFLVDPLKTNNRKEKGAIKRLAEVEDSFNSLLQKERETQKRERRKNVDLQKEPFASHIKKGEWNDALLEACKIGNKEIIEMMFEKGANNWNEGLIGACEGGNKEIIEMIIEKGGRMDWDEGNEALKRACKGGNKEIVEMIIEKGGRMDWNEGLFGACEGGNKEIIELMIEKGANNWNEGLYWACKGGNKEIAELIKRQGGKVDWSHSCNGLCN